MDFIYIGKLNKDNSIVILKWGDNKGLIPSITDLLYNLKAVVESLYFIPINIYQILNPPQLRRNVIHCFNLPNEVPCDDSTIVPFSDTTGAYRISPYSNC